jgi:hypothetical protein
VYVPTLSNSRNASHSFIAAGWTAVSADFRANDKATENIAFDGAVEWSQHAGPCAACKTKLSFFLSFVLSFFELRTSSPEKKTARLTKKVGIIIFYFESPQRPSSSTLPRPARVREKNNFSPTIVIVSKPMNRPLTIH